MSVLKWFTLIVMLAFGTLADATSAPDGTTLRLTGNGLIVAGQIARFGVTSRAQAIALVAQALGKPSRQGSHGDCGQGDVIGYSKFRGDFELSFVKNKLSGWTADAATPTTDKGIGVGMTLATLRKVYPDADVDPGDEKHGGLGPSFGRDGGPNGWLDGIKPTARITGLFSGATCLAGI